MRKCAYALAAAMLLSTTVPVMAEDVTSKTYDADIESFVPIVYINGLLDKEGSVIPSHLSQFLEGDYGQSND